MTTNPRRRGVRGAALAAVLAGTAVVQAVSPLPGGATAAAPASPAALSAPADASTGVWAIDANRHFAADTQEEGRFGRRSDEFYIASVAFRTTPGVRGSTRAWFHGGLYEIDDIDRGEYHTIGDGMGRVTFSNVRQRGLLDVLSGRNPEIVGTIAVVFESDSTPFRLINDIMTDMAGAAQTEIANLIEPLTLTSLGDQARRDELAADMRTAASRIRDQAMPNAGRKIRIALASLFDPDDIIGFRVNMFAAADSSIADIVRPALRDSTPASVGVGGVLERRSYWQRFAGDGATYDILFGVD